MGDCHLGGWREPILKEAGLQCFEKALDLCSEEKVDFILISGDLFDSSRPTIEVLERVVKGMKNIRDQGMRIYLIEGSHDFSPTGKTITRVLEGAGLLTRVAKGERTDDGRLRLKFTVDQETGARISGLVGRSGSLERTLYENLDRDAIKREDGFKIFMFHSGLEELKPAEYEKARFMPISLLPPGCDYYAGGHVHKSMVLDWKGYGKIAYPGPLFPDNFRELEAMESGGFYIVSEEDRTVDVDWKPVKIHEVASITVDAKDKSSSTVEKELQRELEKTDVEGKIVLIRIEGCLSDGTPSDIDFRKAASEQYKKGAILVKKNTSKLTAKEYEEIRITSESRQELEDRLVREHAGKHKLRNLSGEKRVKLTKSLLEVLSQEKGIDETNVDYEERLTESILNVLCIEKEWNEYT